MKNIRKRIEHLLLIFASLILLQSCVVYQRTNVSLNQAASEGLKAKVETKTNVTYKFKRIEFEEGKFYGVKKIKGEVVKIPLNANELNKIRMHNKSLSTIYNIALIPPALLIFYIANELLNELF